MYKILIIGPFPYPITGKAIANKVVSEGLTNLGRKVLKINTNTPALGTNFGKFSVKKLAFIKFYLEIYKILLCDVVYVTIGLTFFGVLKFSPFIFIARLFGKKIVLHLHGNYLHVAYDELKGLKRYLFKKIIQQADVGIVLSPSMKRNFQPFLKDNQIVVVQNFFEKELYLSENEILTHKKFGFLKIIFLSNLIIEKGILELLDALKELQSNHPNTFECVIAGHLVDEKDFILERIKEIPQVKYLDILDIDQKKHKLLASNILCLPTYYKMEGQPLCIIEGMALGNAIVTTKHAAIPDIVDEKNAVFCDKKDTKSLYQALVYLLENPQKHEQICRYNIRYAQNLFSQDNFIGKIDETIKNVITN